MKPKKKDDDCWEKGDPKDCGPKEKEPLFRPFNKGQFRFSIWYFLAAIVLIFLINSLIARPAGEMVFPTPGRISKASLLQRNSGSWRLPGNTEPRRWRTRSSSP
jgi:hypothetical protein